MPRTILIHLNVEVPDSDARTADELATEILYHLGENSREVVAGRAEFQFTGAVVAAPLVEEI